MIHLASFRELETTLEAHQVLLTPTPLSCLHDHSSGGKIKFMSKDKPATSAKDFFPERKSLKAFRDAAEDCRGCDLWERGTQTVFGEGARRAEVLFVGEQPGNEEDLSGKPFVGPAGRLLDDCLVAAGIDRSQTYAPNVLKHFKWEPRGKRRIHKKPNAGEVPACRPWLEAEISLVKPKVIVCLGATA